MPQQTDALGFPIVSATPQAASAVSNTPQPAATPTQTQDALGFPIVSSSATSASQPTAPQPQTTDALGFPVVSSGAASPAPSSQSVAQPTDDGSFTSKAWNWLNEPITQMAGLPTHREGAGPIETGVEEFASGLTSPLSLGLAIASFGTSAVEAGLVKAGVEAVDAAGLVSKAKLAADVGFFSKYGIDFGTRTLPQAQMYWNDYQNAKTDADKEKALDRFEEFGTESVLGALSAAVAFKGIVHDAEAIHAASPKGQALAQTDYGEKSVLPYSEALRTGVEGQATQIFNEGIRAVPDDYQQSLIALNRDVGGDVRELESEAQLMEQNPATRHLAQMFRDAKNLTEKQIAVRDIDAARLDATSRLLDQLHLLPEEARKPNYVPRSAYEGEETDPSNFLDKRIFPRIGDALAAGLKPLTLNFSRLVADYHEKVQRLVARTELADNLAAGKLNDGAPLAAPGRIMPGFTAPPENTPVTPTELAAMTPAQFFRNLTSGRMREVEPIPAQTITMPPTGEAIIPWRPGNELPGGEDTPQQARFIKGTIPEQKQYVWVQDNYVKTGLSKLLPISAEEAAQLGAAERAGQVTPGTLVRANDTPFPNQAIIEPGMRGIPGADAAQGAQPTYYKRVPVYAAPEIAPHLLDMLDRTGSQNRFLRGALGASGFAKSALLSLSPFHFATIFNRALESGTNPFTGAEPIDYFNLTDNQKAAIRDGITTGNGRPSGGYLESEGVTSDPKSIVNKIPLLGGWNKFVEEKLFGPQGYITRLKFKTYDNLKGEILKSNPTFTDEQAGRLAAEQVNNKYGGLNYELLGRSAGTQRALRLMFLAPDFLESTVRSMGDIAQSHGSGLVKSFVAFNVAHWMAARALNYLTSPTGDTHPETGFSVLSPDGKKQYNLRTTLGDFLHFAEKPWDFAMNRVNPALVRVPTELALGVDQQGHRVSNDQKLFDTLRQTTPIPLQGLYPRQQITQPTLTDQALQGFGVRAQKVFTPAETLALQIGSKRNDSGPLEGNALASAQQRFKLEDDLRSAISLFNSTGDATAKQAATKAITDASTGANATISREQAAKIIKDANVYPTRLLASVEKLPLEDAFTVYATASMSERRKLDPIIQKKIASWGKQVGRGDKTPRQIQSVNDQIVRFNRERAAY